MELLEVAEFFPSLNRSSNAVLNCPTENANEADRNRMTNCCNQFVAQHQPTRMKHPTVASINVKQSTVSKENRTNKKKTTCDSAETNQKMAFI